MELNPLKFVSEHPIISFGIVIFIIILIGGFFLTNDGKALIAFMVEHPVFPILFGIIAVIGLIWYLFSRRVPNLDEERGTAEETIDAALVPGKWLARYIGATSAANFDYLQTAQHPSKGRYYWGHILEHGMHKSFVAMFNDTLKSRHFGDTIRDYSSVLTDTELDKAMKKGMSLEDALRAGEQADEYLRMAKTGQQEREEKKEFWKGDEKAATPK